MAKFNIGNLVTCEKDGQIFNADIIGVKNSTLAGAIAPEYLVRDYAVGRNIVLRTPVMDNYSVPHRFRDIVDWQFLNSINVREYDGVARNPPEVKRETMPVTAGSHEQYAHDFSIGGKLILKSGTGVSNQGSLKLKAKKAHCDKCAQAQQMMLKRIIEQERTDRLMV